MSHLHLSLKKNGRAPKDDRPLRSMTPYEKKIQKALKKKDPTRDFELRVIVNKR